MPDLSGSSFYNMTTPGNSGSVKPEMAKDDVIFSAATDQPADSPSIVNPPYQEPGAQSFAPLNPEVLDPSFQPQLVDVPNPVFQFQPWMILAAGALIVLLMRPTGRQGYRNE